MPVLCHTAPTVVQTNGGSLTRFAYPDGPATRHRMSPVPAGSKAALRMAANSSVVSADPHLPLDRSAATTPKLPLSL